MVASSFLIASVGTRRGHGKNYDSRVDEADTNEHFKKSIQAASSRITWIAADLSSVNRPKAQRKDSSQEQQCQTSVRQHAHGWRDLQEVVL